MKKVFEWLIFRTPIAILLLIALFSWLFIAVAGNTYIGVYSTAEAQPVAANTVLSDSSDGEQVVLEVKISSSEAENAGKLNKAVFYTTGEKRYNCSLNRQGIKYLDNNKALLYFDMSPKDYMEATKSVKNNGTIKVDYQVGQENFISRLLRRK